MFVIKLRKTFLFFNVKSSCDHGYLLSKDELKISNRLYKIFNLITVLPKVEYPLEEKTQKKKKQPKQWTVWSIHDRLRNFAHSSHALSFFSGFWFGLLCILKYILVIFRCCCRLTTFFQSISSIYVKFLLRFRFFFVRESPIVSNAIWLNLAWIWIRNVLSIWPISSSSKVSSISYKFLIGSVASFVLIIFILISYNILVIHIEDPSHEDPST